MQDDEFEMKSQSGLSQEKSDELTRQHNIGNCMRDYNGNSHLGGKYLNYQQEYKKMRQQARAEGKLQTKN